MSKIIKFFHHKVGVQVSLQFYSLFKVEKWKEKKSR